MEYASLAGEQAAQSLAYEEAARLFAMAVMAQEARGTPDPAAQCRFLLSLGEAQTRWVTWTPSARSSGLQRLRAGSER